MLAFEMTILMFKLFVTSQVVKWCQNKCKWGEVGIRVSHTRWIGISPPCPAIYFGILCHCCSLIWGLIFQVQMQEHPSIGDWAELGGLQAMQGKFTQVHFNAFLTPFVFPCLPANSWGYFVTALMEREEIEGNFCYSCARAHLALVRFPDPLVSR